MTIDGALIIRWKYKDSKENPDRARAYPAFSLTLLFTTPISLPPILLLVFPHLSLHNREATFLHSLSATYPSCYFSHPSLTIPWTNFFLSSLITSTGLASLTDPFASSFLPSFLFFPSSLVNMYYGLITEP